MFFVSSWPFDHFKDSSVNLARSFKSFESGENSWLKFYDLIVIRRLKYIETTSVFYESRRSTNYLMSSLMILTIS